MARSTSSGSALDLAALMRKLRKHTKMVVQENLLAKRTIAKLRRKNSKLKARLEHLQQQSASGGHDSEAASQARMCENCREIVHPDSSCIYHPGVFYDVEGEDQRELDSDSDTFGMWSCCEKEDRDAIGCERSEHCFSNFLNP